MFPGPLHVVKFIHLLSLNDIPLCVIAVDYFHILAVVNHFINIG